MQSVDQVAPPFPAAPNSSHFPTSRHTKDFWVSLLLLNPTTQCPSILCYSQCGYFQFSWYARYFSATSIASCSWHLHWASKLASSFLHWIREGTRPLHGSHGSTLLQQAASGTCWLFSYAILNAWSTADYVEMSVLPVSWYCRASRTDVPSYRAF